MARPQKTGIDYFPKWNPQRVTARRFTHSDQRKRYTALRNSSGAFVARKGVREFVFAKNSNMCVSCHSNESLQVDHVVSVYRCSIGEIVIAELNTLENLQTLCGRCNAAKSPNL